MAEDKKTEEAVPAAAPSAPAGGGNKMVMILTMVNLMVTCGIIGLLFMQFMKEKDTAHVSDITTAADAGGAHGEAKGGEHGAKTDAHGKPIEGKADDSAAAQNKMVKLDQFTVNLATVGTARPRFVRVDISIEVLSADTEAEVARKMPQVRNTIIDLFNSKRPTDLATPEGRNYLKDEIRSSVNSFLVTGKLKGVYFTAFALSS